LSRQQRHSAPWAVDAPHVSPRQRTIAVSRPSPPSPALRRHHTARTASARPRPAV